jgi:hypothetical protein
MFSMTRCSELADITQMVEAEKENRLPMPTDAGDISLRRSTAVKAKL